MKGKKIMLSVVYVFATYCVNSLNILAIFPYPGGSHFFVNRVYLLELANKGHNLTVISHFPNIKPIKNYHDIDVSDINANAMPPFEVSYFPFLKSFISKIIRGINLMNSGRRSCKVMLANKKVQELIAVKPKFDLVVVEQFNSDCALGLAYKLEAPVVGISSHQIMPWQYSRYGIPQNPSFVPFIYSHGGTKPSLFQKMEVTFFDLYFKALYFLYEQRGDQHTLAQYFDDIPLLENLAREIKFLLVYHNFILTGSRLFPANIIEVGGYHVAKAKPLSQDLQNFINDAEHGIIYISFGTLINNSSLTENQLEATIGVMENLPQRFIWKWENTAVVIDRNKVHVSNWLPQVDILGHPKTLAFFSHAGMAGTTEAIHYGVPMIAMPFFGDQPANAAAIEECGLGVRIQAEDLNYENLLSAIRKVLSPKFKENVKRLSQAWHDRPMPPLETAIYWTEFAARYSNFTFRAPSADIPIYQYCNLDLIFVCLFAITIIIFVLKITMFICSKIIKKISQKLYQKDKKNV